MDEHRIYEILGRIQGDVGECKAGIKSICISLDRHIADDERRHAAMEQDIKDVEKAANSNGLGLAKMAGISVGMGMAVNFIKGLFR